MRLYRCESKKKNDERVITFPYKTPLKNKFHDPQHMKKKNQIDILYALERNSNSKDLGSWNSID